MKLAALAVCLFLPTQGHDQPPNARVKRTPLAETPVSPRMGYEGYCVWYAKRGEWHQ